MKPARKPHGYSRLCSVAGCVNPACSRGLCSTHRLRMNKHGTTDLVRTERRPYPRKDPEERFWAKVSIPADVLAGCWVWTSAKTTSGYGKFGGGGVGGRTLAAHRVAWTHEIGRAHV